MTSITVKYAPGDIAYFQHQATATIFSLTVLKNRVRGSLVFYDVIKNDTQHVIENVSEEELLTFTEAKAALKLYLETKLALVNSMVAP